MDIFEPERFRRKNEELINAVLNLRSTFDLGSLLQQIVEDSRRLVDAEFGGVGIAVSPEAPMEPCAFAGIAPEVVKRIGGDLKPVGVLGEVALAGRAIRIQDVRHHPGFHGFPEHHPKVTSFLGLPISFEGRTIGAIYLANRRDGKGFGEDDEILIKIFSLHFSGQLAQVRLRNQLAVERAQLESILEHAPHGILYVGDDGRIIANPAADALLGQPLSGLTFKEYEGKIIRPDGSAVIAGDWPRVSRTELSIITPDGRTSVVRGEASLVRGPTGEPEGFVVAFEDIGAWKKLEQLRKEFTDMVAHDLRNPIEVMLLEVQVLLRDRRDGEVRVPVEALERLQRNGELLGEMVSDMLDATTIEAERLSLLPEAVSLSTAVPALIERIRSTLGAHPIEVEVEQTPLLVQADALRLDQILTNLIDNAAKYSEQRARIAVHVSAEAEGATISVKDRGPGIAPEELPHLFDRFYQSRRAREKRTGLGLGLFITKGLVEAQRGRIEVHTELGRGSVFSVWLPRAEPS